MYHNYRRDKILNFIDFAGGGGLVLPAKCFIAYLVGETGIKGDVVESGFFQSFFGFVIVPRGNEFLHVDVLLKFEVVAHERQNAHLDESLGYTESCCN